MRSFDTVTQLDHVMVIPPTPSSQPYFLRKRALHFYKTEYNIFIFTHFIRSQSKGSQSIQNWFDYKMLIAIAFILGVAFENSADRLI